MGYSRLEVEIPVLQGRVAGVAKEAGIQIPLQSNPNYEAMEYSRLEVEIPAPQGRVVGVAKEEGINLL